MKRIKGISNLEADILIIIWDKVNATVKEVYESFQIRVINNKETRFISYITFMYAMNNLVGKKILSVDRTKKAYTYSVVISRKELTNSIINTVKENLWQ